ncbi:PEPxxWA-CTERM sorting domain-containing protein [Sphingomonas changnyeongensis]|uniref:PEPxxWA-CTERM sorting domain-containing protein n=1 Tax=Sphingomonas changnyeongensis TaxID=2698679 RepID=A0A7Z2S5Y9_9SPHN|nr:PEPxxWA-CTERM sorting domain-containing protein [Sphingomonas changnyeongensis]QHL90868.1 PEPxxWA-CTERM sorting domain-containing protein [Sphingomonas changnyeongensis]
MKSPLKGGLLAGAAFGLAGSANAAITVHTTSGSFTAAATGLQTDTFNDLSEILYSSPLSRSAGSFSYQASAANGLFPGSVSGNRFLSTNTATNLITFANFGTAVSAIGGRFFGSDRNGDFIRSPSITLTATDTTGSVVEVIVNPTTSSFRGFTTTGSFVSLLVAGFNPVASNPLWPSVDDLQLGTAVTDAIPEPASWAMMISGLSLAGAAMRRRRVNVAFA